MYKKISDKKMINLRWIFTIILTIIEIILFFRIRKDDKNDKNK